MRLVDFKPCFSHGSHYLNKIFYHHINDRIESHMPKQQHFGLKQYLWEPLKVQFNPWIRGLLRSLLPDSATPWPCCRCPHTFTTFVLDHRGMVIQIRHLNLVNPESPVSVCTLSRSELDQALVWWCVRMTTQTQLMSLSLWFSATVPQTSNEKYELKGGKN